MLNYLVPAKKKMIKRVGEKLLRIRPLREKITAAGCIKFLDVSLIFQLSDWAWDIRVN